LRSLDRSHAAARIDQIVGGNGVAAGGARAQHARADEVIE
jgi:hypothetical protein